MMAMLPIILAAGVGKRFAGSRGGSGASGARVSPGSHDSGASRDSHGPKCLVEVCGQPLLARYLESFRRLGLSRAAMVVGYEEQKIRQAVNDWSIGVEVTFLSNPDYRKGAILSLWTARELLSQPVIVMDADVFFPHEMLERLVRSPHASCFLLDESVVTTGEEQMLMARDGRVHDIQRGAQPEGFDAVGESVGFLKLSRPDAFRLRELLAAKLEAGLDGIEHEQVYPALLRERVIGYELVGGMLWSEIDTPEDLRTLEQRLGWGQTPAL